ncbi:MAG: TadE family type IV pilus minor pilin [Nitriliruptorales bacterium]
MTGHRGMVGWPAGQRPAGRRPAPFSEEGSLSLELALTVPALFLLMLVVFHAAVYARDALLTQDAARRGARVAATSLDDGAIHQAVRDALDGRPATVTVQPSARRAGDVIRVTVVLQSRGLPGTPQLTATAVAAVEPGVGE